MPDRNAHVLQATKNEQFFSDFDLDNTRYLDWATVSLFYAALHLVDAYLAGHNTSIGSQNPEPGGGHHPRRHNLRRDKIINEPALNPIDLPYRELKQRSEDVRYDLHPLSPTIVKNLAANEFTTVKNHIDGLI